MLLFLHGADSFRLHQRLLALKQGFIKKYDSAGFNIETILGSEITLAIFKKAALTWGLLQEKRLVVVKDIFDQKNESILDDCAEILKELTDESIVIFTAASLPAKKNNLLTQLLAADKVEEFKLLKGLPLAQWLRQKIKSQQIILTREAGEYLLQVFKDDLWSLNNAVDILANYSKKIALAEVQQMVPPALADNIFDFTDALSQKDAPRALKLLHHQIELEANPFYLLSMLARQIKILWQVKQTQGQGLNLHPFVLKKALAQGQKFSLLKLSKLYSQLLELDARLKSTKINPETLLDLWIIEACS